MILKEEIAQFQEALEKELEAHDQMLSQWEKLDWHDRYARLDYLLHRMWGLYDKADELSGYIRSNFPPYPFSEINDIKRWLKKALHRLEDFMSDDYQPTDTEDYQNEYVKWLAVICDDNQREAWQNREAYIANKEQELLSLLQKSYSVILELLINTSCSIKNNPANIILGYANSLTRYDQLQWGKDEKLFQTRIETNYPWDEGPTAKQLQDFYATQSEELINTPCGKAYMQHHKDTEKLAIAIAKLQPTDEQLTDFFRRTHELEYLQQTIRNLQEQEAKSIAENGKKMTPFEETFTFVYRNHISYPLFVDFMCKEKDRATDADWARHALVIYDYKPTVLQNRPNTFTQWLHDCCELFGRKWVRDYEPEKLRKTNKKSKVEIFMPAPATRNTL